MGNSVEKSIGERLAAVVSERELSATEIARRLRVEYTGLSHFHRGRRQSLPGGVKVATYVALLEELTGAPAEDLGIADLRLEAVA